MVRTFIGFSPPSSSGFKEVDKPKRNKNYIQSKKSEKKETRKSPIKKIDKKKRKTTATDVDSDFEDGAFDKNNEVQRKKKGKRGSKEVDHQNRNKELPKDTRKKVDSKISETIKSPIKKINKKSQKSTDKDSDFENGASDICNEEQRKKKGKRDNTDLGMVVSCLPEAKEAIEEDVKDATTDLESLNARNSPRNLKRVVENLTKCQKERLKEIGFGDYIGNFDYYYVPGILGRWLINSFNPKTCTLGMGDGRMIKITRKLIHDTLGIPMGQIKVKSGNEKNLSDPVTMEWRKMVEVIVGKNKKINITKLKTFLCSLKDSNWLFDIGFISLFFSIFGQGNRDGTINEKLIPYLKETDEVHEMDWCSYVLESMVKECSKTSDRFSGPVLALAIIYVNSTESEKIKVKKTVPAFKAWNSNLLLKRQQEEYDEGDGFGRLPIVEGLEYFEPKKVIKKKQLKSITEDECETREKVEEFRDFYNKPIEEMKEYLRSNLLEGSNIMEDTDNKIDIALHLYPDDKELKSIIEQRNKLFVTLYKDVNEIAEKEDGDDKDFEDGDDDNEKPDANDVKDRPARDNVDVNDDYDDDYDEADNESSDDADM